MTQENFNKFISEHKVVKIEPNEFSGHVLYFENGDWINVGAGYDGITYEYHYPGEVLPDTIQLMKDLSAVLPDHISNLKMKYGEF